MNPLTKRLIALGASSVIAITGGLLVAPFEGKSNKAYLDMVGIPTVCFGETKGVKLGDYRSDEHCEASLASELTIYNEGMKKNVRVPLTDYEEIAYTSFVWNVGLGAWNSSTLLKKLNAGDREGACKQILVWNKATFDKRGAEKQRASGEVCTAKSSQPGKYSCTVKGLTNRRVAEYQVCMDDNADVTKALEEVRLLGSNEGDVSSTVESKSPEASGNVNNEVLQAYPTPPLAIDGLGVSSTTGEPRNIIPCRLELFGKCLWKGKGV